MNKTRSTDVALLPTTVWLFEPYRFSFLSQREVPVPVTGVRYNCMLWMCTLNTLTWPDLTWPDLNDGDRTKISIASAMRVQ